MFYMAARLKEVACVGLPMPKVTSSLAIYIYYWRAKLPSQHLQHKIIAQVHLKRNLTTKASCICTGNQCNDFTSNAAHGPLRVHLNCLFSTLKQYMDFKWFPAQG